MPSLVLVLLSTAKNHMLQTNKAMFESENRRRGGLC